MVVVELDPTGDGWEGQVDWNKCLLPRIRDTLGDGDIHEWTRRAITRWVRDHFGPGFEWEWVHKTSCRFRLVGRQNVYLFRRIGKWFEVFHEFAY